MTEENKQEFEKTKLMTPEQVKEIISTNFGVKLKMNEVKAGHHVIMKILKPVEEKEYEYQGATNKVFTLWCKYKTKGFEPFELEVQVGEKAVERLKEKYPDNTYVDMYAYFSRTAFEGGFPQFINPIKHYDEPVSKDELFKKASPTAQKEEEKVDALGKLVGIIKKKIEDGSLKKEDVDFESFKVTATDKGIEATEEELKKAFESI